jgi:integrase-like protein
MLFLPDSKTGRKAVVLNAIAMQVLGDLERIGNYVIAGDDAGTEREKPRADLKRPWRAITRRARLDGLRIHDLRHSFASVGAGGGVGLPIVGKLLGHADQATTARYAHLDNDPLRLASNDIGKAIADALCTETLLLTDPLTAVDYGSLDTPLQSTIISIRRGTGVDRIGQSETACNCPKKSNALDAQLLHLSLRAAHVGTGRSTDERHPALPATGGGCSLYPRDLGPALLFVMAREARSGRRRPNL